MNTQLVSIRPFIGSKDFEVSRKFYQDLGWEEIALDPRLSLIKAGSLGFYLQDAYVKDWLDNTMVFMEVESVEDYWKFLSTLHLPQKYPGVRLVPIKYNDWGNECFLIDPAGALWHFGEFRKSPH